MISIYFDPWKPPGDPKYDIARVIGDPRSLRKLRLLDGQREGDVGAEKWYNTVVIDENNNNNQNLITNSNINSNSSLNGTDKNIKSNNFNLVPEKKKKKLKIYSGPLAKSANERMNKNTNTLLLMLSHIAGKCTNSTFEENLKEFKEIQDKNDNDNEKKMKKKVKKNGLKQKILKLKQEQKLIGKKEKTKTLPLSASKYTIL